MDKNKALKIFMVNFINSHDEDIYENLKNITKINIIENKNILFTEGQEAEYFYYIIDGNIKLSKITPQGKETIIRIVHNNEIFAEATLYGRKTYPVNAAAVNKTTLLAISIKGFQELCSKNNAFVLKLFITMSHQLRYLVDMINDLSSTDTTGRLLKYLYSLKEKKGSSVIKLPIPKRDLAMLLGAAPETISRLFTKLQNDGLIKINAKEITILEKDN